MINSGHCLNDHSSSNDTSHSAGSQRFSTGESGCNAILPNRFSGLLFPSDGLNEGLIIQMTYDWHYPMVVVRQAKNSGSQFPSRSRSDRSIVMSTENDRSEDIGP